MNDTQNKAYLLYSSETGQDPGPVDTPSWEYLAWLEAIVVELREREEEAARRPDSGSPFLGNELVEG